MTGHASAVAPASLVGWFACDQCEELFNHAEMTRGDNNATGEAQTLCTGCEDTRAERFGCSQWIGQEPACGGLCAACAIRPEEAAK